MHIERFGRMSLALLLGAAFLAPAALADFNGGGSAKSDCYVVYKGITVTSGKNKVECTDGDPACDTDDVVGTCSFGFTACFNEPGISGCTPSNVTAIQVNGATLNTAAVPSSEAACGDGSIVSVPLKSGKKGPKKGKVKLKVKATSASKPKSDKDVINFFCNPGGTTTTTLPPQAACPANGDGTQPNTVLTTMLPGGSDLDNGWTGTSFNFPVIEDVSVTACLASCDKTTDPTCDVTGPTGTGSINGPTLGPPLPLVAGGVAVCVVNRFQNNFTGTVNLQTGESLLDIKLFSDVFITNRTRVCPRCETGTCDDGPNKGKACTVDGKTRVEDTFAANKIFQLSKACPPFQEQFLSTLNIQLAPTTGTATTPGTGGSKPCREDENKGVPAQDDNCGGAKCSTTPNCSGTACVSQVPNPSNPAEQICVDTKGGLSQLCCNGNGQIPCHPTFPGGPGISRQGRAVAAATPTPWGDDQYPKTASGVILVSTFCEGATGSGTVDITTGLPGPGALIFNTDAVVSIVTPPAP